MNKTEMKAAVLAGPEKIEIMDVPIPEIAPGNLQIRLSACGVCGSDVHMWKQGQGWNPGHGDHFWMGHEFCGVVTNPGDSDFKPGDRVTFWANLYCGKCDMCMMGKEHLCRQVGGKSYIGFVCNGGYAEYFSGPIKNAYRLPDSVSDTAAALIDPLMVAYHAVRHSGIRLNDKILVSGSGIIAQLIGTLAKRAGASIVAMSRIDDRQLELSRKIGDFNMFFKAADPEIEKELMAASRGGFDLAFEAVGHADSLALCMNAMRPGGKIVLIGNSMTETVPFALNKAVLRELELSGSVSCTRAEFAETIDLIASGFIDPERYVTDIFPLEKLQTALEKQSSTTEPFLKSVIKFQRGA